MHFLEEQAFLVMQVEYSTVGVCFSVKKVVHTVTLILLFLMWWIYADMDFLDFTQMDMIW